MGPIAVDFTQFLMKQNSHLIQWYKIVKECVSCTGPESVKGS